MPAGSATRTPPATSRDVAASCDVALASALDTNIRLLDGLPALFDTLNVPPTIDLAVLDATSTQKYGLLPIPLCEAVDVARGRLAAVRRAMDHLANAYVVGVGAGTSPSDQAISSRKAMLADITGTHIPVARSACEHAVAALRGHRTTESDDFSSAPADKYKND